MSIIEIILNPIFWLVSSILSVIPSFSLPASATNALNSGFALLGAVGYFLPLGAISASIVLMFSFYAIKFGIHIFNFLIRKVPAVK